MKAKAIVVGLVSVVAAVATFTKTTGQVFARSQPQLAIGVDPSNVDAKARLAALLVSRPDAGSDALAQARTLALAALRSTPGHVAALRSYGLGSVATDPARAAAAVESAAAFAKRDTASQMWLVNHYASRGADKRALDSLGLALRTSAASRPLLFPALLQTIGEPGFQAQMVGLLAPSTDWSASFWDFVATAPTLPDDLAALMEAVGQAGGTVPRRPARDIVGRLASTGQVAEALAVLSATERQVEVSDAALGVQDFSDDTLPAPFGWDVVSTGRLYGQAGAPGELRTDVRPGSQGFIARRLVATPPAGTVLSGTLAVTRGAPTDAPVLTIRCAQGGAPLAIVRADASAGPFPFHVRVPSGCLHQWIEITSPEVRGGGGSASTFTDVTLRPGPRR